MQVRGKHTDMHTSKCTNNTTVTHAGTHTDIRSCGFISIASAPDTSAPIGWLWACIHNEGLKREVLKDSDVSCFVFLASRGTVCASCLEKLHPTLNQHNGAELTKQGTLSISLSDANCRWRRWKVHNHNLTFHVYYWSCLWYSSINQWSKWCRLWYCVPQDELH